MTEQTAVRYPLKAMTAGEILDNAFRILKDHFLLLLGITLAVSLPFQLVHVALLANLAGAQGGAAIGPAIGFLLTLIPMLLLQPIAHAATTKAVADRYLGRPATFGGSYGYAFSLAGILFSAILWSGLLTLLGFIALVIPGIYLMLRFAFVSQIAVMERKGGKDALKRSAELMKDNYGRVFLLYLVTWALAFAVGMGANIAAKLLAGLPGQPYGSTLISGVITGIAGAYGSALMTVAYLESRCRKEGFDLQVMAESLKTA